MIRSIRYKITEDTKGIEPKTKQWAGMQYEDNATVVEFDISNLPHAIHSARIDFDSAAAGYHPSVNLQVSNSGIISREIPKYITQYGGDLQIVAVITTEDGLTREADAVCYSYPVTVYFTPVSKSEGGSEDVEGNISEMENVVREMAANVESNLQTTDDYRKETELYYREAKGLHDSIIAADVTAEKLTETKQEAEELINTVEQKLANGDFNGKDGKDGKDGANGKDAITDQTYDPNSPNAQSGKAVAEALSNVGGGLKDYELICDTTLTEDLLVVRLNTPDDGEPIGNYKDYFIYFLGKFTESGSGALYCTGGGAYFMYKTMSKADTIKGFWLHIETIAQTDEIDANPSATSVNGTKIYRSTYPASFLGDVSEEKLQAQGLSANNQQMYSDIAIYGADYYVESLTIGQSASNTTKFASGSRFIVFGRK